jgi:hypothetical protein
VIRSERRRRLAGLSTPWTRRLPRLDHVRNLYKDASDIIPADRKIRDKTDLVAALRNMTSDLAKARVRESGSVRSGPPPLAAEEGAERPMSANTRSLVDLEATVLASTRYLNSLTEEVTAKTAKIGKLEADLAAARSENKALNVGETPEGAKISELEEEIATVEHELEEQEYRRRQLEHMEHRLKGNSTAMDAHIKSMEDALTVANKELGDVRGYLRQLENGKDQALHELQSFHSRLEDERRRRAAELDSKRAELDQAKKAEAWRRQRESVRAELAAELAGDLSKEQEEELKATKAEKERLLRELEIERREREERASALHEAFQQIKGITGVTTLDEMTERFLGHEAARESLQAEREEAEQRLAAARAAVERAERELAELRATGADASRVDLEDPQEAFSKVEAELSAKRSQLRWLVTAADRVQNMVVAVRQGAAGMAQRLAPFEPLLRPAAQPGSPTLSDEATAAFGFAGRDLSSPMPIGETAMFSPPEAESSPLSPGAHPHVTHAPAAGRVDVQKQGREAFRLLRNSLERLNQLVALVDAAVSDPRAARPHRRASGGRRRSVSKRASNASKRSVRADGKDGEDSLSASYDSDDSFGSEVSVQRGEDYRRLREEEEVKAKEEARLAREAAQKEVMGRTPVFTMFGLRGRQPASDTIAAVSRRMATSGSTLSVPLEDPVPHPNNVRVHPVRGGGGDQGSVAGSVMSSARSKGISGAASVAGSRAVDDEKEAEGEGEDADDDAKSFVSSATSSAARAQRRRRRKQEALPDHKSLKQQSLSRVKLKKKEAKSQADLEKNRDKIEADMARKATLAKLTKTTRAPTGMGFLTQMPKLL